MGDSSDNIPGVKGIGEKTALNLLHKFGSLDAVYENLEDPIIKPKQRENLITYKENAYLSYDLATIRPEAPIDFEPMDAVVQPPNRLELYKLFTRLEFVRLIDRYGLRGAELEEIKDNAPASKCESLPRVEEMPADVKTCAVYLAGDGSLGLAWDCGVCALTPMEVQMVGLDFSGKDLILHDSKSTMHRLDGMGVAFGKCIFDTALAAYDLNPSQSDYPVSKLATNFLGVSVEDEDAAGCAEAVWNLRQPLQKELKDNGMEKLYADMELPLCRTL